MRLWKRYVLWISIALWFAVSSSLVLGMSRYTTRSFDHDMRLSSAMMSLEFERDFVKLLSTARDVREKTVVHFQSNEYCFCEDLVQAHIRSINTRTEVADINTLYLNLDERPEFKAFVPSTPAIAVINDNKLAYFGPYSQGSGCFSRSGQVDKVLSTLLNADLSKPEVNEVSQGYRVNQALIINEASGCYCKLQPYSSL